MKEGIGKVINSHSKTFLTFCFCFILGAGVFSLLENKELLFYLYISAFAILFFIIIYWQRQLTRFILLCLLVFILGGLRFFITIPSINSERVEFYAGSKQIIQGFIFREPDIRISEARYIMRTEKVGGKTVRGNVLFKTLIYPEYNYADQLEVSCFLQEPANLEGSDFNYKKYLAKQGIRSTCANPKIKILGNNKGNIMARLMLGIKNKITTQMRRLWPEPDNSLMAGILYGARSGLPADLTTNFSRTGVTHIVAVSGYNVSIIVVVLNAALIYLGLLRKQSFWMLVFLIVAFVFFTGASASVVRAGVMAVIVLLSQYVGRLSAVGRVLVYAVVIMLFLNPYLLMWDAGFQLSFLSTLGLVYLSPVISTWVEKKMPVRNNYLLGMQEVLLTTIAAIGATLPLIMYQFGRFSVVAPLVNVLVLWIIPWLMLFGFLSLILSFIFFPLGQLIAWMAGLGTQYVILVVNWFGRRSWAAFDMKISLFTMILIYLILILFVTKKYQKVLGRQNSPR
jgi:competence protein ComEC